MQMDPSTATQILESLLKGKGKAKAFLESHPHLSIEEPEQALELIRLASARTKQVVEAKAKPLPLEARLLRKKLASQDWNRLLHTAKTLALCSLPIEPVSERTIIREAVDDKGTRVHVKFSSHDPRIPLPYGNDRALITWLMTLAREKGSARVEFDSALEFFNAFGITDGGKNYEELREAMERISNVVITYGYQNTTANVDRDLGEKIVYDKQLPTRSDARAERTGLVKLPGIPSYYIQFGEQTFKDLVTTPVSLPLEILREYRNNPTSWDLLNFIVANGADMQEGDNARPIPLAMLSQFLGSRDKNIRKLKMRVDSLAGEVGDILNFSVIGRGSQAVVMIGPTPPEFRAQNTPTLSGAGVHTIDVEISDPLPAKALSTTTRQEAGPKKKKK